MQKFYVIVLCLLQIIVEDNDDGDDIFFPFCISREEAETINIIVLTLLSSHVTSHTNENGMFSFSILDC